MKKLIAAIILATTMSVPCAQVYAGSGDTAAGAAFGFLGGTMLGSAMSGSRGSSRAERDVNRLRSDQQTERIRKMEQQSTTNILLFVIAILFFGLIGLAAVVLKKKK